MMFFRVRKWAKTILHLFLSDSILCIFLFILTPCLAFLGIYNCGVRYSSLGGIPSLMDCYMYILQPGFFSLLVFPMFSFSQIRLLNKLKNPSFILNCGSRLRYWKVHLYAVTITAFSWYLMIYSTFTIGGLIAFRRINNWAETNSVFFILFGTSSSEYGIGAVFALSSISFFGALALVGVLITLIQIITNHSSISFLFSLLLSSISIYGRSKLPFQPLWLLSYRDLTQNDIFIIFYCAITLLIIVFVGLLSEWSMQRKDFYAGQ